MSDIPWFKVLTDIFSDDKIKIIQSMPEGDSLLVMWFKVLSQAGKTNDGGYIYLKKSIPYSPAMLATLFGKQQQIVELAIRTFSEFGMIDVDDKGYIFVTNWEKHQSVDKLAKIKEQTRARVSAHREKKKLELMECNVTVTLPVTQGNATDIELDKDKELKHIVDANASKRFIKPTIQQVIEYCQGRNNAVDANKWFDYYESNGWRVGKNSMKDWKAAVRTWEKSSTPIIHQQGTSYTYSAKDREAENLQKALADAKKVQAEVMDFEPRTD